MYVGVLLNLFPLLLKEVPLHLAQRTVNYCRCGCRQRSCEEVSSSILDPPRDRRAIVLQPSSLLKWLKSSGLSLVACCGGSKPSANPRGVGIGVGVAAALALFASKGSQTRPVVAISGMGHAKLKQRPQHTEADCYRGTPGRSSKDRAQKQHAE